MLSRFILCATLLTCLGIVSFSPRLVSAQTPRGAFEIDQDNRVSFKVTAAKAESVSVNVGGTKIEAAKVESGGGKPGTWTATTEPLPAGIHEYYFDIDGVRVLDANNRWFKKWNTCANLLEIKGPTPQLTEQQSVPHGALHNHFYASSVTKSDRPVIVYTPPGYALDKTYPLLVLCHGFGDDQTAWTEVGRANLILDNLIAAKKIEPLVVVMPFGHPIASTERNNVKDYFTANNELLGRDVMESLLPFVKQNYRVSEQPSKRAIVGLSMGGGHSLHTAFAFPGQFDWVGAFSAATPQGEIAERYSSTITDAGKRQLLWIACGENDFLLKRNREFLEQLNQQNIQHTFVETAGGHSWPVWRGYLPEFLQLIFTE